MKMPLHGSLRHLVAVFALTLLAARVAPAQIPGVSKTAPAEAPAPNPDPLGRETPRGSVLGFLRAIRNHHPEVAVEYLQLPPKMPAPQSNRLATQLGEILDEGLFNPGLVSNKPEGGQKEGLVNKERIGSIRVKDSEYDLTMVRVPDVKGNQIWLFSREVVAQIPEMYQQVGFPEIEDKMPSVLVKIGPGGVPLWKSIATILLLPLALLVGALITKSLSLIAHIVRRRRGIESEYRPWRPVMVPAVIIFGLVAHLIMIRRLGFPVLYRYYYNHFIVIAIVVCLAWIFWRLIDRATSISQALILRRGYLSANAFVMLMQRMLKAVVIFLCFLAMLSLFGVDTKAALAGLGIGGLAIAFAAQKTLENLLGGVSVIFDQVVKVGDFCRLGDRMGTVEDISLRSTRVRTLEGPVLSVPNGALSTMNIENITERRKILFNPTLTLRYETTADQLRKVLADIRTVLYSHPQIEPGNCRARLSALGVYSVDIEIFSYVMVGDFAVFTAIREDLLLRIFDVVRDAGTDFAFPSQRLYWARDPGIDPAKAAAAAQQVAVWREEGAMPFPDFAPDQVERLQGTLRWPPDDSAVTPKFPERAGLHGD